MTVQQEALVALAQLLDQTKTPYMVIGGLANIVWGEPRATLDIDVTVWVPDLQIPDFIETLSAGFDPLVENPAAFVERTRVLPVQSCGGVKIDVIFGMLPYEEEAIARATAVQVGDAQIRFCTPEDLILMKIISERERDLSDAREVTRRRLPDLNLEYLEPRIRDLARLLDRPDIQARWEQWKELGGQRLR